MVWYYQHVVDHWDLDHPFERILVDTAVAPNPRDVIVDQPESQTGRAAQGRHRHSRQDRRRLHARPDERGIPLGAADRGAERHQHDRGQRRGDRQSRSALDEDQRGEGDLPERQQRRQELAGRRLQPAHEHDVHAVAEHVHDGDHHHRHARPVEGLRPPDGAAAGARHEDGGLRVGHLRGNRHDDVEGRATGRACCRSR